MKRLLVVGLAIALAGCAVAPRDPRYGQVAQPRDPSQWRVVSVTPVPAGTAARVAAKSSDGKPVEYSSTDVPAQSQAYRPAPLYPQAPVYTGGPVVVAPAPVYYPAPVYLPEPAYSWPPVTLSLGFIFGRHWGGHGGARWGHRRFR